MSSVKVEEVVEYPAQEIADALTALPGLCVEQREVRSEPRDRSSRTIDWWDFRWSYRAEGGLIEGDFTLLDDGPQPIWGGSNLTLACSWRDLLVFWKALRVARLAIYLHDENCRIHTPESLVEEFVLPGLEQALADGDPEVRRRAAEERQRYRELSCME